MDLSTPIRIRCSVVQPGPQPKFFFVGLSYPVVIEQYNDTFTREYLTGFSNQSSGVFTCSSSAGYEIHAYIVTQSGMLPGSN